MKVVDWFERSPVWLVGRFLFPARVRLRACEARGEHRLDLVDVGRSKACGSCGTGLPHA